MQAPTYERKPIWAIVKIVAPEPGSGNYLYNYETVRIFEGDPEKYATEFAAGFAERSPGTKFLLMKSTHLLISSAKPAEVTKVP